MKHPDLHARWNSVMERDLSDLQGMLDRPRTDPLRFLPDALDLRAYRFDLPLASRYSEKAVTAAQDLLNSESFRHLSPLVAKEDEQTRTYFVHVRHADILRTLAYAKAINGNEWDVDLLRRAGEVYREALQLVPTKQWSVPHQWMTHSGAIALLGAGQPQDALSLLTIRNRSKATQGFHDRLLCVAKELARDGRLRAGAEGMLALEKLFSILRQPERDSSIGPLGPHSIDNPSIRRFEVAFLRDQYVLSGGGKPQVKRVFESLTTAIEQI